jgi:hypothetical protein
VGKREWKKGRVLAVFEQTGEQIELPDVPHFSPTGKYIVAVSQSEAAWNINGIDLWSVSGAKPKREFSYRVPEEKYELYDFVEWRGNDEVLVRAQVIETFPGRGPVEQERSGRLRRTKQGWHLSFD